MPRRPNVLVLMSDHTNAAALAPESACIKPNFDTLAGEGVRFARCYTTNAICSPARASLMTATYPSTHGMWDCTHTQRAEWVNVHPRLPHWSQHFSQAGYRCGYFGKWHVEQSYDLGRFGWHEHDAKNVSARPRPISGTERVVRKAGYRDYLLAAVGSDEEAQTHPAYDRGIDFIRRSAESGQPWVCFVSTAEPHDPYVPPKRFFEQYDASRAPISPTLRDEPSGKPEVLRRQQANWASLTDDDWRFASTAYRAVISFLDAETGRLIDALRRTGQYDDTIVLVTSDHGDMLGGHGLVAKGVGTSYEEVYNIPLILRGPGIPKGREDARTLTSLVDLGPTLLDLCGLPPLPESQGRTLRGALNGSADPSDWQDAYAEFYGQRLVYTQRIVWHGRWKYVFSPGGIDELYDLQADPNETRNLAGDAGHREVLLDMCRRMWRQMRRIGDNSLLNTHYATLRAAPIGPLSIEQ